MEIFKIILIFIIGFCLGNLFRFMDRVRTGKWDHLPYNIVLTRVMKAMFVIIVAIAAIFMFLIFDSVAQYIQ